MIIDGSSTNRYRFGSPESTWRTKFGNCDQCPRGLTFSDKALRLGRSVIPHCLGRGPEKVIVGGSVDVNDGSDFAVINRDVQLACPTSLVPAWRFFNNWFETSLYDSFEAVMNEMHGIGAVQVIPGPDTIFINEYRESGVLRSQPRDVRRRIYNAVSWRGEDTTGDSCGELN